MEAKTEIGTKRLLLRPFEMADGPDLLEYANDAEWVRYQVNVPHPFTRAHAQEFLMRFSDPSSWSTQPMFAMVLERKVVGQVYLHFDEADLQNERAELGYMLSRDLWGRGLATEAAQAVVSWGFEAKRLHRIYAYCDPRNVGSWKVMEKIGMHKEGLFRQHLKWNGEYRDALYYGMLSSEWPSEEVERHGGDTT